MVRNDSFYEDFESEIEYVKTILKNEGINPAEVGMISSLESQKAALEGKKIKLQQDIENIDKQIAKLDQQINTMKVT